MVLNLFLNVIILSFFFYTSTIGIPNLTHRFNASISIPVLTWLFLFILILTTTVFFFQLTLFYSLILNPFSTESLLQMLVQLSLYLIHIVFVPLMPDPHLHRLPQLIVLFGKLTHTQSYLYPLLLHQFIHQHRILLNFQHFSKILKDLLLCCWLIRNIGFHVFGIRSIAKLRYLFLFLSKRIKNRQRPNGLLGVKK